MNSKVLAKTASAPEGPWSEPITLYQATPLTKGSSIYAAVPHDYYDRSGRTLVVTFTNHPNVIQAIRITFGEEGGPV
jgi:beta-xylosidase